MKASGCQKFRFPSERNRNNSFRTGTLRRVRFWCCKPRRIANREKIFCFCGDLSKESEKTLAIYRKTCIITCMPAFWLWGKMSAAMERNEKGEIE